MTRTILITGSTDGLGLETAKVLAAQHHHVLLHGRSQSKLDNAQREMLAVGGTGVIDTYRADLSRADEVIAFADAVTAQHERLDVLINNAGVFRVASPTADNGLDVRFMVNTIAPYMLTLRLLPILDPAGRVINLSSAAQGPVDPSALKGQTHLHDSNAYAQSKLAITMWSNHLAQQLGANGPAVIAVNPGSFLGTKMVKEAYGRTGVDIGIGVDILTRAATSAEFAEASGQYYDNDAKRFASPHPDALNADKNAALVALLDATIDSITN